MTSTLASGVLVADMPRTEIDVLAPRPQPKATSTAFADTLAQCAAPLFPLWPMPTPLRNETIHAPDSTMAARATDQRRERRQRSRG